MPKIEEISPAEARRRMAQGSRLLDVREAGEHALGLPEGALPLPRAELESRPEQVTPDTGAELLLICGSGRRSMLAAQALQARGYARLCSVAGGYEAWCKDGLPTVAGAPEDADFLERYSRHLRLPQVGLEGQRRLAQASVLLVGAGGLGSPAALYLAAAGVGRLVVADDDVVDRSNLQRQVLHTEDRIGLAKVASAHKTLAALNPRVQVQAEKVRVTDASVDALLQDIDVVLDGADNFPVRYVLNAACLRHAKPLVYGAVHRFEGQVSVFDAGRRRGEAPCYRCLFPEPPAAEDAPNCAEAGVLGVLPGVIGLLQATEVIKLLLGVGEPLAGRLLHFDALAMRFRETRLRADPDCPGCGPSVP